MTIIRIYLDYNKTDTVRIINKNLKKSDEVIKKAKINKDVYKKDEQRASKNKEHLNKEKLLYCNQKIPPKLNTENIFISSNKQPIGLKNYTGLMCYFNALMQCLISSREFENYFKKNCKSNLYNLTKKFINSVLYEKMVYENTSLDLLHCLKDDISGQIIYTGKECSDPTDFLLDFLYQLNNEIKSSNENFDFLSDKFEINIAYKIICNKCKNILSANSGMYYFKNISGEAMPTMGIKTSVQHNLIFYCNFCDKYQNCIEESKLKYSSIIMFICDDFNKSEKGINISFTLNDISYSLFGIIVYIELSKSIGHYIVYANRNNEWFLFNDNVVTKIKNFDILSQSSHIMFFYEKTFSDED
ncbi:putative ubiquitin carboxyl-terminal hydrolase 8 [Astathelohania contejeani]|uniref:Ubiquitin carboxyl-terminal hydrolase 8 n=1 Tax=Astathelohania contejeani TaxID=164912 RepID=A0ABQ7HVU1_9MICR|nr:putative ubiquitin carboxyl-terminal hydrolase 8 [Thelohania contejeani]